MPQRYDADALLTRLNQRLPSSTAPNHGGILHPGFSSMGRRESLSNADLLRAKSEDLDLADDVPAPWLAESSTGVSLSAFGRDNKTEPAEAAPYGSEQPRQRRPNIQCRRQSSSPPGLLPSLHLHNHFGHEVSKFDAPVPAHTVPHPAGKPLLRRYSSLDPSHEVDIDMDNADPAIATLCVYCGRTSAALHCEDVKGVVGGVSRAAGTCHCGDGCDDVA
ncbi:hypothetical protein LTR08_002685 [Meristemomyces frigidus]|nr:hypothetical protein LTR08_002685 [Meristemomyces frigidus]